MVLYVNLCQQSASVWSVTLADGGLDSNSARCLDVVIKVLDLV